MPSKIKYFKSGINNLGEKIQTLGGHLGSQDLTARGVEGYERVSKIQTLGGYLGSQDLTARGGEGYERVIRT